MYFKLTKKKKWVGYFSNFYCIYYQIHLFQEHALLILQELPDFIVRLIITVKDWDQELFELEFINRGIGKEVFNKELIRVSLSFIFRFRFLSLYNINVARNLWRVVRFCSLWRKSFFCNSLSSTFFLFSVVALYKVPLYPSCSYSFALRLESFELTPLMAPLSLAIVSNCFRAK